MAKRTLIKCFVFNSFLPFNDWHQIENASVIFIIIYLFSVLNRFDLLALDASRPEDEKGIRKAAASVHSMIAQEIAAGIPSDRIVIGGFSQGGALALFSALTFPQTLAGVVAMSTWLPLHQKFPAVSFF